MVGGLDRWAGLLAVSYFLFRTSSGNGFASGVREGLTAFTRFLFSGFLLSHTPSVYLMPSHQVSGVGFTFPGVLLFP